MSIRRCSSVCDANRRGQEEGDDTHHAQFTGTFHVAVVVVVAIGVGVEVCITTPVAARPSSTPPMCHLSLGEGITRYDAARKTCRVVVAGGVNSVSKG